MEETPKSSEEAVAALQDSFKKIKTEFDEVMKEITEKGHASMTYADGAVMEIDASTYQRILLMLTSVNEKMDKVRELSQGMIQSIYSFADVATMELMAMNTLMAKLHIANCEKGITIPVEEYEAQESKKKVELVLPDNKLILPDA